MVEFENLTTPFLPLRDRYPKCFCDNLSFIEQAPLVTPDDKNILLALIFSTTNPNLLKRFSTLNYKQLGDLATLASIGLGNLRGHWKCEMGSVETVSGADNRATGGTDTRLTVTLVVRPTVTLPGSISSSQHPLTQFKEYYLGLDIIEHLGIQNPLPTPPRKDMSPQAHHSQDCTKRQDNKCLLCAKDLTNRGAIAHLFPPTALNFQDISTILTWRFLAIILGEEKRNELSEELLSAEHGAHTTANSMYITPLYQDWFDRGRFWLVPVRRSREGAGFVDVRYHRCNPAETMDALKMFCSEEVDCQYLMGEGGRMNRNTRDEAVALENGQMIRIATNDPDKEPVPSTTLLFFHQYIWQVPIDSRALVPSLQDQEVGPDGPGQRPDWMMRLVGQEGRAGRAVKAYVEEFKSGFVPRTRNLGIYFQR